MIVPFIYDFSPAKTMDQLWAFFAFLTMQKKVNGPIIAPQEFFEPENWYKNQRSEATAFQWAEYNCYDLPEKEDLDRIEQIVFPAFLMERMQSEFSSQSDLAVMLHKQPLPLLVEWFENTIRLLQQKEPVQAVMTLGELPSLNEACRRCGVKAMHFEWGPLRPPSYLRTAYLDELGVIYPSTIEEKYAHFLTVKDQLPILDRKALLALFLQNEYLACLQMLDSTERYEVGLCAQESGNFRISALGYRSNADMIGHAKKYYKESEILFRDRPSAPLPVVAAGLEKDRSITPAQFMCRCKRVVSLSSNMAFEAMLWGKDSVILGQMPYKFMCSDSLRNETRNKVDDAFLSFVLLAFLVPYRRVTDLEYLRWRCSDPPIEEIYLSNLSFYCREQGLDESALRAQHYSYAEILRQKGFTESVQEIGMSVQEPALNAENQIQKFQLLTSEGAVLKTRLFQIDETGNFEILLQCSSSSPLRIRFLFASGVKTFLLNAEMDGMKIDAFAENALTKENLFAEGDPIFRLMPDKEGVIKVQGNYQPVAWSALPVQLLCAEQKYMQQLQVAQELKMTNESYAEQLENSNAWSRKLERDIQDLNGSIDHIQKEKQQLLQQIAENSLEKQQLLQRIADVEQERQNSADELMKIKKYLAEHRLHAAIKLLFDRMKF